MSGDFGDELKAKRIRVRLSQSQLARRAELSHSYISRLEAGTRMPTREAVDRLADALRVTQDGRDELLAAAGLLPTNIIMINQASECGDLHRYLEDPAIPFAQRHRVRTILRELLAALQSEPAASEVVRDKRRLRRSA